MKSKTFITLILSATLMLAITACNGNKGNEASGTTAKNDTTQVIDNKDEVTFLTSFLNCYVKLNGKQAQALAQKHLTQDFYSSYIENCNNQDNAIDVICEVLLGEKVDKIVKIEKGLEDPSSFIVLVMAKDAEGKEFPTHYDMTVVKENGKFKLADSQIVD